jgi:hypothetical protein
VNADPLPVPRAFGEDVLQDGAADTGVAVLRQQRDVDDRDLPLPVWATYRLPMGRPFLRITRKSPPRQVPWQAWCCALNWARRNASFWDAVQSTTANSSVRVLAQTGGIACADGNAPEIPHARSFSTTGGAGNTSTGSGRDQALSFLTMKSLACFQRGFPQRCAAGSDRDRTFSPAFPNGHEPFDLFARFAVN